jgi:hypothetical protein
MAAIINTNFIRQHPAQAVLTVLGLSGVVPLFLEPGGPIEGLLGFFEAQLSELALAGPVLVLPLFVSAGYLRWTLTGGLSRWEICLGYALALLVVAPLSVLDIQQWWTYGFDDDYGLGFICVSLVLGLGVGMWFVIDHLRRGVPAGQTALVALQLAYLPFAIGWLAVGINDLRHLTVDLDVYIRDYLAFLTVLVYTAQAALSVRGQLRVLLRLLPLGLIWVPWVAGSVWKWLG